MASHRPAAVALPAQPFFATGADRAALARERFFDEGQRPTGLVADGVIQSWMRCHAARRAPREAIAFEPVTPTRLHGALQRGRPLLAAAAPHLEQLEAALGGTGCRAILTDGDGVVVHATPRGGGPAPLLDVAARVGVNLSEAAVGTTAPGLVVRSGQACTVLGREHFFDACGTLRCAAAPIRDRRGLLAGALDLTVEQADFGFDAAAIVGLYAAAIENALLRRPSGDALLLRFQASPPLLGTPLEALAGIDDEGRIAWMNGVAERLLGGRAALGQPLGATLDCPAGGLPSPGAARPMRLTNGLRVWLQAELQLPAGGAAEPVPAARPPDPPPAPAPVAATLAECDRSHIEHTLAECGGNIAAAARRLGVSRGLLYRRLRAPRG